MLSNSEYFNILLIIIMGFGLATLLAALISRWWQKHTHIITTWVWMILFTIASAFVMLVLFLLPIQRKPQSKNLIEQ